MHLKIRKNKSYFSDNKNRFMGKFLIKRFFYYSQPVYKLLFHINMLYFNNIHFMQITMSFTIPTVY